MKIGMTYDLKTDWQFKEGDPADINAELDKPQTIDSIEEAFRWGGHEVKRIGNVTNLLKQIDNPGVDIIFNICEGMSSRNRESQVPVLLEMHKIPFVGSDALTLGITLDKRIAKKCFVADGLPTPKFFDAYDSRDLEKQNQIGFPLLVKTTHEGTSKGLSEKSRVEDYAGLKRQVDLITKTYRQPALVEQFISGTEFTVAVLGNEEPKAMPVVQVSIDGTTSLGDRFYTYELVCSTELRYVCPAKISDELTRELQDLAVKAYRSVGCLDFGRVDFRVDAQGRPFILEINPLPSLERSDIFNLFPKIIGTTYEATLNQILEFACRRYGISTGKKKLNQDSINEKISV